MNTQDEDILIIKFLAGEASETEVGRLNTWRNSDPSHEEQFLQSQHIWNKANRTEETYDEDLAWDSVKSRIRQAPKQKPLSFIKIAAAILLICSTGWLGFKAWYNPMITIQTAANEQKEITLPDGSVVWLNEQSTLQYPKQFAQNSRAVFLSGEAFFEVTKNPESPFSITSKQAITEVLGTSFNLSVPAGTNQATLNVVTGKVRFTSTDNTSEVIVVAGEKATIDETGQTTKDGPVTENELSWRTQRLVFTDATLKDVFQSLESYFKITITTDNPDILLCHFTGTFEKPKLDAVLNTLSKALQLNFTRKGKEVTVKGKGCAK